MTSEQGRSGSIRSSNRPRVASWRLAFGVTIATALCAFIALAPLSSLTAEMPEDSLRDSSATNPAQADETKGRGASDRVFYRNERWFRLGPPPLPSVELAAVLILTSALLALSASRLLRWQGSGNPARRHAGLRLKHFADTGVQRMVIDGSADRRREVRIDRHPDAGIQSIRLQTKDNRFEEYCHA